MHALILFFSFFSCATGKLATNDLPLDNEEPADGASSASAAPAPFHNPNVIDEDAELEISANGQESAATPQVESNKK